MSVAHFSRDYATARERFRTAAKAANGRLRDLPIPGKGPSGEPLTIDTAWFGPDDPKQAIVHSSGLHGVEGFAGSAVQLQLLQSLPSLPVDTALVVVHVLNPFGM